MTHTVHLHRALRAPPERVYRAFTDADALCKWLPPYGFTGRMHAFDASIGGGYRMSFTSFDKGQTHAFSAVFRELEPHRRIVHVDRFDDPNLPGEMTVTIAIAPVSIGTDLRIEQSGIPALIPPEACHHGWQESLNQLADLVQHDIPD